MKQTKIVASVSDRRCSVEFIRSLYEAGVNVVRMNTAHATPEGLREIIRNTRAVSAGIGLLIDTKGPEIRSTKVDEPINYVTGEHVTILGKPGVSTTHDVICVSYPDIARDVKCGDDILFDDGALDMRVENIEGENVNVVVMNDGKLGANKSVNVPGEHINLPALTEKDKSNILLAIEEGIDFIAHSFVRSASDVKAVQDILDAHNSPIKIISKIENQEGVDNIDEIIDASYGIMIARGDLGIEVPLEQIPSIQRQIIRKCIVAKKPVIVATQMLHTMIENPRPTRAEVSDIATAIYTRTDAVMLSGETASGKYPIEAVRTMATIAERVEHDIHNSTYGKVEMQEMIDTADYLSNCAIDAIEKLGVKAIITDSKTGGTARKLSSYRGSIPVIAVCFNERVHRELSLSYGISAVPVPKNYNPQEHFVAAVKDLLDSNNLDRDDRVAYLSGPFSEGAYSSILQIMRVKDILKGNSVVPPKSV
ncbi:MAG: pyruvate kinase [Prevotella sp.]|jgi:pyruvate kinase|nr:pyruvate kinase [Prevotella sp.]